MNALVDFVTSSATNYLQSVVFVDDHIYHKDDKPLEKSIIPVGLKPQFAAVETENAAEGEKVVTEAAKDSSKDDDSNEKEEGEAYHPRQLMESFAQKGIVCALYEPRKNFSTESGSELFRLCERADVIILDWDLHNDGGDGVSQLLSGLIKKSQSESPHHVRFCAIYTTQQSLHGVVSSLLGKLESEGCKVEVEEGKLHLIAGATRISAFGKPSALTRTEAEKPYEVPETELANRIIAQFAELHHGVLPAFALHGLASVRRNTKRLLDKFNGDLDGAFLLHRALVLEESEAFQELPELLSDEIRAIIEDSWQDSFPVAEVAASAADGLDLADPNPRWTNQGVDIDWKLVFGKFLKDGRKALYEARENCELLKEMKEDSYVGIKPRLLKSLESMLVREGQSGPEILSALFCNRTQYGGVLRRLHFGTIVRHRREGTPDWNYSLCLMPICDSQRLKSPKNFPFWQLKDNVRQGLEQKRYGVAIDVDGVTKSFAAGGKMREMLWMASFIPDDSEWVTASPMDGAFQFETADIDVQWVAELKPLHAQRIAAHMGTDVSRVGLVESEWLRLFCDR